MLLYFTILTLFSISKAQDEVIRSCTDTATGNNVDCTAFNGGMVCCEDSASAITKYHNYRCVQECAEPPVACGACCPFNNPDTCPIVNTCTATNAIPMGYCPCDSCGPTAVCQDANTMCRPDPLTGCKRCVVDNPCSNDCENNGPDCQAPQVCQAGTPGTNSCATCEDPPTTTDTEPSTTAGCECSTYDCSSSPPRRLQWNSGQGVGCYDECCPSTSIAEPSTSTGCECSTYDCNVPRRLQFNSGQGIGCYDECCVTTTESPETSNTKGTQGADTTTSEPDTTTTADCDCESVCAGVPRRLQFSSGDIGCLDSCNCDSTTTTPPGTDSTTTETETSEGTEGTETRNTEGTETCECTGNNDCNQTRRRLVVGSGNMELMCAKEANSAADDCGECECNCDGFDFCSRRRRSLLQTQSTKDDIYSRCYDECCDSDSDSTTTTPPDTDSTTTSTGTDSTATTEECEECRRDPNGGVGWGCGDDQRCGASAGSDTVCGVCKCRPGQGCDTDAYCQTANPNSVCFEDTSVAATGNCGGKCCDCGNEDCSPTRRRLVLDNGLEDTLDCYDFCCDDASTAPPDVGSSTTTEVADEDDSTTTTRNIFGGGNGANQMGVMVGIVCVMSILSWM